MHKKGERLSCLFLMGLLLFSIATVYIMPVSAAGTRLYVDPPSIIDPTLLPPKTFSIDIKVADVVGLYGFEFKLGYDTNILDLIQVTIPSFLNPPTFMPVNQTREDLGRYWLGISSLNPAPPKSGSGTLVTLKFKVTGIGSCALDLYDTKLSDSIPMPIPHTAEDGYFSNVSPAKLYVNPPKIMNPDLVPCQNFTIDINILNVVNLYSWEFKLYYKNDILNGTSITEGPFLSGAGPTNFQIKEFNDAFNATHGLIWANCTLLTPPPASGNGTLATISFHVEGLGESKLDLTDTKLVDPWNVSIPHQATDGSFNNVLKAHLYVSPSLIFDPTMLPPANFTININVANVSDLYDYEFKLGYDTNVLNCLGAIIIPFENETSFTVEIHVVDSAGFIWINVTYYPPAIPLTTTPPRTLAIIFFQVAARGVTVLDLSDTKLSDPSRAHIPHDVSDGLVIIARHDVAVTNVVPSTSETYAGRIVYINVTVANEGEPLAETFNVAVYYDGNLIGTLPVVNLPSHTSTTLTFSWNTKGVHACHNYTIKAEASIVPYEIWPDTQDNVFIDGTVHIKMIGDINGDGIVDVLDLILVSTAFGSTVGSINWNPEADLYQDGIIDVFDLVELSNNFGKTC